MNAIAQAEGDAMPCGELGADDPRGRAFRATGPEMVAVFADVRRSRGSSPRATT
ncbi:MAG TPA: hypothetical protein VFN28_01770 [Amaricoccus sp.]|nr:hypothetical protein [Amaricoccus sp.]